MSDTDNRPSIAELQRLAIEQSDEDIASDGHICTRCSGQFFVEPDLEASTMCNPCSQHVVADALPVLLEIAAAALALRAQRTVAAKCRDVIHQNHYAGDAAYVAVDTADTELARCQSVYDAALAKVIP